jgi:UDP-GlcNAc:undecaprenyl-phosphate/decaprenyl-phosphate GlcNAc-1-phosphate transferase
MLNIKIEIIFIILSILLNFILFKNNNIIAKKLNLYDIPDSKRKLHTYRTPLNGGIFYFFNLSVIFIFDVFFNNLNLTSFLGIENESEAMIVLFLLFLILLIGIIDDKVSLKPLTKSLLSLIIFSMFLLMKPEYQINFFRFETFNFVADIFKLSLIITILSFLILQIALNMYDGIDLQSATYYSVILVYLLILNENHNFLIFCILTLVNLSYFIINNYQKKTFLGDNGVYIFSFVLSLLIIQTYKNNYGSFFVENIFIILFLPVVDMIRMFFIRLLKNKSPLKPDRRHIHHILLKKYGLIKANILLIFPLIFSVMLLNFANTHTIIVLILNFILYLSLLNITKK